MAGGFVRPYPCASRAARVRSRFRRRVFGPVDMSSTVPGPTLTWNGDVAVVSIVGELVEYVPIRYSTWLADHGITEAFTSRGRDDALREVRIGLLCIIGIVLVEAVRELLLMSGTSVVIAVVALALEGL